MDLRLRVANNSVLCSQKRVHRLACFIAKWHFLNKVPAIRAVGATPEPLLDLYLPPLLSGPCPVCGPGLPIGCTLDTIASHSCRAVQLAWRPASRAAIPAACGAAAEVPPKQLSRPGQGNGTAVDSRKVKEFGDKISQPLGLV